MNKRRTDPAAASTANHPCLASEKALPVAWRKHHARLLQLRERVIRDAMDLSAEMAEPAAFSSCAAEPKTDSFDRDLAFILLSFEENALGEIEAALERIEDGRYGTCELTGEPIPKPRLDAIPWARYTARAQVEVERTSETPRARLNALGSMRPGMPDSK